ncbi:hypothetical protein [Rhizobium sp. PL01]|uniref:helix-turn-helix transcriptional regulator n=1 Tax=Rhizobium sp. PL01 TaxID=3085631 RepID=UPI002981E069|nr:hypothetical protein [Rhizobium sp. PL01]MDW5315503.1 hypothetical protein [Rhizobium sp. PL01]
MRAHATAAAEIPDLDKLPADALLTIKQVSALSSFTEQALLKWAKNGKGPTVTRLEGRPRYRAADIRSWFSGSMAGAQ